MKTTDSISINLRNILGSTRKQNTLPLLLPTHSHIHLHLLAYGKIRHTFTYTHTH